jgi:hypothetical protein
VHKLSQTAQALYKGQPVTIAVQGQFQDYRQKGSERLFQRNHKGVAPADILEPLCTALPEILALSTHYQTEGIPVSIIWTQSVLLREQMDITVVKRGKGVVVTYGPKNMKVQPLTRLPPVIYQPRIGWSSWKDRVSHSEHRYHQQINIIAPWDAEANSYRKPW